MAGGSDPRIEEMVICHQLIAGVVPAMMDMTSAMIGTGLVATMATIPHRSSNRDARAYSASVTNRRTFSLPPPPHPNPPRQHPPHPTHQKIHPIPIPNHAP